MKKLVLAVVFQFLAIPLLHAQHGSMFDQPSLASGAPSADVAAQAVRVKVVDLRGNPVAEQAVILGTMGQEGDRQRVSGLTDAQGVYEWTALDVGASRAYRVNVPFEGATYSSTPFRLPSDTGYQVQVTLAPTTRDDRAVLQLLGRTLIEVKDERLHITQQVQLANMSQATETYVFPEDGLRIELPEGFLAFQSQPVMTDQKVEELAGVGARIRGSLPPGQAVLTWAFDVRITGSEMTVELPVPFRTYRYQVLCEAPEGMELSVDEMPPVQEFEDRGRPILVTEIQRSPGDAAFSKITLRLRGIPGPGPTRWIAVAVAALLMLGGIGFALSRSNQVDEGKLLAAQKREILEEASRLEEEAARGDIGPQYRQSQHQALVRELALLLHRERRLRKGEG